MIDNYDSYVYNLVSYMNELRMNMQVVRNDEIDWQQVETQIQQHDLKGIILSPGPKHPGDFTFAKKIVQSFGNCIPILDVCLGHQMIADAFGAEVEKAPRPIHGKLSNIHHTGNLLFQDIPSPF